MSIAALLGLKFVVPLAITFKQARQLPAAAASCRQALSAADLEASEPVSPEIVSESLSADCPASWEAHMLLHAMSPTFRELRTLKNKLLA